MRERIVLYYVMADGRRYFYVEADHASYVEPREFADVLADLLYLSRAESIRSLRPSVPIWSFVPDTRKNTTQHRNKNNTIQQMTDVFGHPILLPPTLVNTFVNTSVNTLVNTLVNTSVNTSVNTLVNTLVNFLVNTLVNSVVNTVVNLVVNTDVNTLVIFFKSIALRPQEYPQKYS